MESALEYCEASGTIICHNHDSCIQGDTMPDQHNSGSSAGSNLAKLLSKNVDQQVRDVSLVTKEAMVNARAAAIVKEFLGNSNVGGNLIPAGEMIYGFSQKGYTGSAAVEVDIAQLFLPGSPLTVKAKVSVKGEGSRYLFIILQRFPDSVEGVRISKAYSLGGYGGTSGAVTITLNFDMGLEFKPPAFSKTVKKDTSGRDVIDETTSKSKTAQSLEDASVACEAFIGGTAELTQRWEWLKLDCHNPLLYDLSSQSGELQNAFMQIIGPGDKTTIKNEACNFIGRINPALNPDTSSLQKGLTRFFSAGKLSGNAATQKVTDALTAARTQIAAEPDSPQKANRLAQADYHTNLFTLFHARDEEQVIADLNQQAKQQASGQIATVEAAAKQQLQDQIAETRTKLSDQSAAGRFAHKGNLGRLAALKWKKNTLANDHEDEWERARHSAICHLSLSSNETKGMIGGKASAKAGISGGYTSSIDTAVEAEAFAGYKGSYKRSRYRYNNFTTGQTAIGHLVPILYTQDTDMKYKTHFFGATVKASATLLGQSAASASGEMGVMINTFSYISRNIFWRVPSKSAISTGDMRTTGLPGSGLSMGYSFDLGSLIANNVANNDDALKDKASRVGITSGEDFQKFKLFIEKIVLALPGQSGGSSIISSGGDSIFGASGSAKHAGMAQAAESKSAAAERYTGLPYIIEASFIPAGGTSRVTIHPNKRGGFQLHKYENLWQQVEQLRGVYSKLQCLRLRKREYDDLDDNKSLFKLGFKLGPVAKMDVEIESVDKAGMFRVNKVAEEVFTHDSLLAAAVAIFHQ
jgi:hypothetical protein